MNRAFEAIVIQIRSGDYVAAEDAIVTLTGCSRAEAVRQVRAVRRQFKRPDDRTPKVTIGKARKK